MIELPTFNHNKITEMDAEIEILKAMGFNKFVIDERYHPLSSKEYKYYEDQGYEVTYPNLVNKGFITW